MTEMHTAIADATNSVNAKIDKIRLIDWLLYIYIAVLVRFLGAFRPQNQINVKQ